MSSDAPRVSIVYLPRETLDALANRDVERARATSPVEISDWLGARLPWTSGA